MDVADLVFPVRFMIRKLAYFFAIGAALFLSQTALKRGQPPETILLTVKVPKGANASERSSIVRDAILIDQATRLGWDKTDIVVFQHLVQNMRFVRPDSNATDVELFAEARSLGMALTDPVARARMIERATSVLEQPSDDQKPSDALLRAHLDSNRARFEQPDRYEFAQVFIARKAGDPQRSRAQAIKEELQSEDIAPADAYRLGDPLLRSRPIQSRTLQQIKSDFGDGVAQAIKAAKMREWFGPVDSIFGFHILYVLQKITGGVPNFDEVRNQVFGDYMTQLKKENFRKRFAELRKGYEVQLVESQ